ncbi:MAG: protein-L-isoaspartate(D-aspartate) O-methyltransferase [Alphaproteobacteria bacterium]|nr:protein-L-isoaspartate(D-aspartate) O-methyltransferase [Alphaproteobacteria bacterium]MBV9420119.1 protein-L-isoaspartate(D-aspartate) O-methyltransferase [Alphaproteobacteria bacterium]MBV9542071.1 protein-L-isoaspartate(D-aspartate) O-methyltransferase [Alphaproteobacteria bacterium]MBV9903858.1 protein-L-isoaspartate(D-aspartate) O-methyltransferase [Alphaproteobacteria bacterium]
MSDPRTIQLITELRGQGITDPRVLDAIEKTPREAFVDEPFEHAAYNNTALPIACGQTISQPFVVAYMTQVLDVQPQHRVLEIGTGSGYQAAILSPLCRRVYTIERHKPLLQVAEERFRKLGLHNITTKHGDGFKGWPEQAPFDRILLAAAPAEVPQTLIEQLKRGGALIAPVGTFSGENHRRPESFSQRLTKMIRTETGVTEEVLIPVMFVPMLSGLP